MRPLVVSLSKMTPTATAVVMRRGLGGGGMSRLLAEFGMRKNISGSVEGQRRCGRMYGTASRYSIPVASTLRQFPSIARPSLLQQLQHKSPYAKRHVESQSMPPPSTPPSPTGTLPPTEAVDKKTVRYMTKELPKPKSAFMRFFIRTFFYVGIFVGGIGVFVVGFFLYDASTYSEVPSIEPVHASSLALYPRIGGPKNLPIVEHFVDDDDSDHKKIAKHKPKIVILGTGWGAVAMLKTLKPEDYHITVISPSNQFLFTPMLPSATVGTLELRSLVEPVRKIVNRVHGHFLKAMAVDVVFPERLVEVEAVDAKGVKTSFYLPYDKLVVACGSVTNPHGVPGLENCHFLKDIHDARAIRNAVIRNLEHACLPTTTDIERRRLLSFVVCGGGPTGVEFAAELYDMLNEDLVHIFPKILRCEISVHVIQSRGHILNTYDEALSKFAEAHFERDHVNLYTNARVKEVQSDKVLFTSKEEDGTITTKELPMGFCLWSTGVSQTSFAAKIAEHLQGQTNKHALETDGHCRVVGAPLGDVYAIGDCATVQNNVSDNIVTFLRTLAWEKGKDPESMQITYNDWLNVAKQVKKRFPQAKGHLRRLDKLFEEYDQDKSGTLDFAELSELLKQIDNKLTSLPATAQRAHQQGEYLAKKFSKIAQAAPGMQLNEVDYGDLDEAVYKPFTYHHLGSLAYVGNSAIFDLKDTAVETKGWKGFAGNVWAVYLWRGVYFAQSVSFRTRCLLAMDWTKRALFGRDMMNVP